MEASYRYKARDKFGSVVSGNMMAENEVAVASRLKLESLTPFLIESDSSRFSVDLFSRFRRLKLSDLNAFTREFYTLHRAGLTVLASLEVIAEQDRNLMLRDIVEGLLKHIRGGLSISESLAKYPRIFSPLYINMFKSGEAAGQLEQVLERLLYIGETEEKIQMRVKAALRYPLIVFSSVVLAFLFLSNFIIPRFAQLFASHNVSLPLPTRILLGMNYITTHYGIWVIAGVVLSGYLFSKLLQSRWGRRIWDQLMLKFPVFGSLILLAEMSRFSRVLAMLVKSGVPLVKGLEIVQNSAMNVVIVTAIERILKSVTGGSGMEQPMRASGVFPDAVVRMVKVGEETGKLDELLLKVSEYYDMQIEYRVSNLMVLIEPTMIVVLGGMIMLLALGMFLPMWNMIRLFRT